MIQALLPALVAARGRVINISSIGGLVAGPTYGAYAASKFGLEAMSDALRREVGHLGVDVVVVQPGGIATPIWTKGLATAEQLTGQISADQRQRYGPIMAAADQRAPADGRGRDLTGPGRRGDRHRDHHPPAPDALPGGPRRPDHGPGLPP